MRRPRSPRFCALKGMLILQNLSKNVSATTFTKHFLIWHNKTANHIPPRTVLDYFITVVRLGLIKKKKKKKRMVGKDIITLQLGSRFRI